MGAKVSEACLPKKIAFLNRYQGKVNRGAETFVAEVSTRLASDFKIDVISEINYWKIFKRKYDVIVPTNGREQVFIVRIISWLTRGKMVVSGQSGLGADDKWNLLMFPDVFVALTHYQRAWAKKFNSHVKVETIPNGVDLNKFSSKNIPLKINLPHPIVLSVGALETGKRLELSIKAVAKTKASLLLVGKGSLEKDLQKLGDELMPGRLKITSFAHSDMPKVYTACDLFTYPTVAWESFGIAVVEAMASGLPVVANNDPIRREIVGSAGLFVEPNDVEKYTETLEKALKVKWGDIPRRRAEKFDWDEIALKYKLLFENL